MLMNLASNSAEGTRYKCFDQIRFITESIISISFVMSISFFIFFYSLYWIKSRHTLVMLHKHGE